MPVITVPPYIEALGPAYARLWSELSEFPSRAETAARIRLFKPHTLVNLDSQGRGPGGRCFIGGRVCYPRDEVVLWFAKQARPVPPHPRPISKSERSLA